MTAAGRPQRDGLSIGAVLSQLRPEFPDITISKIRFLESEGLVRPGRTPSGYRQFTAVDVARLRFVLSAQRDHYLPLKVIKEQLDAADSDTPPPVLKLPRGLVPVDSTSTGDDLAPTSPCRLTREDLLRRAGIDASMLVELEQYGLVRAGAAGFFDAEAVEVARIVQAMTEFGLEPRHLRAFRAAVDREVGLLEQVAAPLYRQRGPEAQARAGETVRELAALSVALHSLLLKSAVHLVGRA